MCFEWLMRALPVRAVGDSAFPSFLVSLLPPSFLRFLWLHFFVDAHCSIPIFFFAASTTTTLAILYLCPPLTPSPLFSSVPAFPLFVCSACISHFGKSASFHVRRWRLCRSVGRSVGFRCVCVVVVCSLTKTKTEKLEQKWDAKTITHSKTKINTNRT